MLSIQGMEVWHPHDCACPVCAEPHNSALFQPSGDCAKVFKNDPNVLHHYKHPAPDRLVQKLVEQAKQWQREDNEEPRDRFFALLNMEQRTGDETF